MHKEECMTVVKAKSRAERYPLLQKCDGVKTHEDLERLEMHTEFWCEKLNT
jgi:hypothetical protein